MTLEALALERFKLFSLTFKLVIWEHYNTLDFKSFQERERERERESRRHSEGVGTVSFPFKTGPHNTPKCNLRNVPTRKHWIRHHYHIIIITV